MSADATARRIDALTIIGLAILLMPLLTMWHEIGGHAAACAIQGGHVTTIGAFYVDCSGLAPWPRRIVAMAGVVVDTVIALAAYAAWTRLRSPLPRLVAWYVWVGKGFVAAGYLCFSGLAGIGDYAPGQGLGDVPMPYLIRGIELLVGVAAYIWLVRRAMATLTTMIGNAPETQPARRRIAHLYYAAHCIAAVVVGLFNPVGIFITLASAAASSFGGNAGYISVGYDRPSGTTDAAFTIPRNWAVIVVGVVVLATFAIVLGPSIHPQR